MELWVFWLILGVVCCIGELVFPTAFFELTMGVSALVISLVSLVIPYFVVQAGLWLLLSAILALLTRKLVPPRKQVELQDATEAKTLTPILPGRKGRVLYEGNSWSASCADPNLEILANQKVLVIRREGTTLIVAPSQG
jgi:membrane protein implicated in regulation of membrane protease activity